MFVVQRGAEQTEKTHFKINHLAISNLAFSAFGKTVHVY